jgi:hypothetical protein
MSSVPGLAYSTKMSLQYIYHLEKSTALLARQKPWWEPGGVLPECTRADEISCTPNGRWAQCGVWAGHGRSMSYVDLDARMAFGFAPNRWITGPHEQQRSLNILSATYACLAKLAAHN